MSEIDKKLEEAVKDRQKLAEEIQRIQGKKEAAEANLAAAEEACRSRKVEPDQLDATIEKLKTTYEQAVEKITAEIETAREKLAPFLGEKR